MQNGKVAFVQKTEYWVKPGYHPGACCQRIMEEQSMCFFPCWVWDLPVVPGTWTLLDFISYWHVIIAFWGTYDMDQVDLMLRNSKWKWTFGKWDSFPPIMKYMAIRVSMSNFLEQYSRSSSSIYGYWDLKPQPETISDNLPGFGLWPSVSAVNQEQGERNNSYFHHSLLLEQFFFFGGGWRGRSEACVLSQCKTDLC